jgi:hypothetical protein
MTFNYRVIRKTYASGETDYAIHEVYYNDKYDIESWSEDAICAIGDDLSELNTDVHRMLSALTKPVLEEVDNKLVEVKQ